MHMYFTISTSLSNFFSTRIVHLCDSFLLKICEFKSNCSLKKTDMQTAQKYDRKETKNNSVKFYTLVPPRGGLTRRNTIGAVARKIIKPILYKNENSHTIIRADDEKVSRLPAIQYSSAVASIACSSTLSPLALISILQLPNSPSLLISERRGHSRNIFERNPRPKTNEKKRNIACFPVR